MPVHVRARTLCGLLCMPLVLLTLAACVPSAAAPTPQVTSGPVAVQQATVAAPSTVAPPTTEPPTAIPATHVVPIPTPAPTATPQPDPASAAGGLIYQRADGILMRGDSAGTQLISLTEATEPDAILPWAAAPDGKTLAVVSGTGVWYQFHDNPTLALWLVGADGSNPRKIQDLLPPRGIDQTPGGDDAFNLVPALTAHQELAWSPDGQLVAFVSAHENQVDLYTAALDGTITRLSDTPRLEQGPRWSPDGTLLAYRTTSGFGTGAGWGEVALEVAPRAGGQPVFVMDNRQLADGTEAVAIPDLFWISPNLIIIGLASMELGNAEVRTLTIDARTSAAIFSEPYSALAWNDATRQLAIAGASAAQVKSSPQGRKFAPGLFTWSPDAGAPTQIETAPVEVLAWAPAGDALAYSLTGGQPGVRVWEIGAEGDVKTINATAARQLRWSLDGQRLATDTAVYGRDGRSLFDFADQAVKVIGWGADGLFYYTVVDDGNHRDLWLWDGAQPQPIDTALTNLDRADVVLAKP